MNDCLFCKIINHQIPSYKVYEDDLVLAFLTKDAINEGHLLVIPKEHQADFHKVSDESYIAMMKAVKLLATSIEKVYKPKKVGMLAAGFDVPHAHIHVLPMYDYNDITSQKLLDGSTVEYSDSQSNNIKEKIIENISS